MICDDRDTLLYIANLGSIELHPWMSRLVSPDSPDYAVIDLDPKEAPFTDVIAIARRCREVLEAIGLRPLLKTSGKTGLHVVLPLVPGYTYDETVAFCEGIARIVARDLRDIATVERAIGSRAGKVYVDFGQNRRGQTVVPPYSVRPVRGASVSAPLAWDELTDDLRPIQHTIQTMPNRLRELGDLFEPLFSDQQELGPAIEAVETFLRSR
jgi:bifunctional non-homologous end joining protein LigD